MPRPELWTRIAAVLAVLRQLLRTVAPEHFTGIASEARAHLAAAAALIRRYIHVLAAEIFLPERPVGVSAKNSNETPGKLQTRRDALFRLVEEACAPSKSSPSEGSDPPFIQWAMMLEAARRLALVLNNPEKHAKRLAHLLRRRKGESLKDIPVPAHILRRLAPWTDALILRLDEEARPAAWAGLNTS